ncbi:hypothetical protein D8674_030630 [Pyrus ussuriensis x Pyrus communis]|uniref:Retroviral polymerase SH3-like domain-containing protein n=1 Tax=Pyrus ussuriensis x Pyrus communis TaxID=2448454 RepID=A0A5N5F1V6_9ROSA|nr:hypothetical protein D8674_030630 [Pyrus ussuriensis x Pyrus communis]
MGLCLLAQSHLPQKFWVEAFTTVAFLIKQLPLHHLGSVSPYEKLFAKVPDYRFLKTFGCTCFPHLVPYNKHKLMPKSIPCVFIGYDNNYKGYRCLDVASGKVYISRNVQFDELTFPYNNHMADSPPPEQSPPPLFLEPLMPPAAPMSPSSPTTFHRLHLLLLRPTLHPRLLKRLYPLHLPHIFRHLAPPLLHHRNMSPLQTLLLHANLGASMLLLMTRPGIHFLTG